MFQEVPARCGCCKHFDGCLCGDCASCSDSLREGAFESNFKRYSVLGCCLLLAVGFVVFVPVVPIATGIRIGEGSAVAVESNSTSAFGSLAFCYLGQGAAVDQGVYYLMVRPTVKVNEVTCQTSTSQ